MSVDDAKSLVEDAEIDGPLVDWKAKGSTVEYLGTEDVDGTLAHKLKVVRKNGDMSYVYLDPDYFLEIRIVTQRTEQGAQVEVETDLGDYEKVDGVFFPFSIEAGPQRRARQTKDHHRKSRGQRPGRRRRSSISHDRFQIIILCVSMNFILLSPSLCFAGCSFGAEQAPYNSATISGLGARNIGSADHERPHLRHRRHREPSGKITLFVGAASGGVWKSEDGGTRYRPVFDEQPVQSIGAIALDPKNSKNVWVGTGESWTRNSVSIGDGIYKSTDGGETWTNVGSAELGTHRARSSSVRKTATPSLRRCPGALWSDSPDRGLYKTTDGGKTWNLVLKGANLSTGASTIAIDPTNPNIMFAAHVGFPPQRLDLPLRRRRPERAFWQRLVSLDRRRRDLDGNHSRKQQGFSEEALRPSRGRDRAFESEARLLLSSNQPTARSSSPMTAAAPGTSATRVNWMVWRPFYFANLIVDPKNPDRVFKTDGALILSEDGGQELRHGRRFQWRAWRRARRLDRSDQSANGHLRATTAACGIPTTAAANGGRANNLPISQFYHVSVDDADPYQRLRRLAGQQLLGRPVAISRRDHQCAVGKHVRWRRFLDVRRSGRSRLHLRRISGRLHRPGESPHASKRATFSRSRTTRKSCA